MSAKSAATRDKPAKPWQRAEAGVYRSSDERFTIGSEGPSRWFITDDEERDELGLARTIGPFGTLDEAKEAADARRGASPTASPLAKRIAEGGTRQRRGGSSKPRGNAAERAAPAKPPPPPPKTWLDKLEDDDRDAARRARRMISALEDEGIADAEDLVRRDITGNQPAVAARLLARSILSSVGRTTTPDKVVEAVFEAIGGPKARRGLPSWELVERDGPTAERRTIRLVPADLKAAAEDRRE